MVLTRAAYGGRGIRSRTEEPEQENPLFPPCHLETCCMFPACGGDSGLGCSEPSLGISFSSTACTNVAWLEGCENRSYLSCL